MRPHDQNRSASGAAPHDVALSQQSYRVVARVTARQVRAMSMCSQHMPADGGRGGFLAKRAGGCRTSWNHPSPKAHVLPGEAATRHSRPRSSEVPSTSIVVAWRSDPLDLDCVLDTLAPRCQNDGAELIVVCAGEVRQQRRLANLFPGVRFILAAPHLDVAGLRQIGAAHATGDVLVILDQSSVAARVDAPTARTSERQLADPADDVSQQLSSA